jgi:hypothetical protein
MSEYYEYLKNLRLDKMGIQTYKSLPFHPLNNRFDKDEISDAQRFNLILDLLHSVKDGTFDGLIHKDDFFKMLLFFSYKFQVRELI